MLFKRLFDPLENLSTKEYWEIWEIPQLLGDLKSANALLSKFSTGYSERFLSPEGFYMLLDDEIDAIEFGGKVDLSRLYNWFAPGSVWDDLMLNEDNGIGKSIYARVLKWHNGTR